MAADAGGNRFGLGCIGMMGLNLLPTSTIRLTTTAGPLKDFQKYPKIAVAAARLAIAPHRAP